MRGKCKRRGDGRDNFSAARFFRRSKSKRLRIGAGVPGRSMKHFFVTRAARPVLPAGIAASAEICTRRGARKHNGPNGRRKTLSKSKGQLIRQVGGDQPRGLAAGIPAESSAAACGLIGIGKANRRVRVLAGNWFGLISLRPIAVSTAAMNLFVLNFSA